MTKDHTGCYVLEIMEKIEEKFECQKCALGNDRIYKVCEFQYI